MGVREIATMKIAAHCCHLASHLCVSVCVSVLKFPNWICGCWTQFVCDCAFFSFSLSLSVSFIWLNGELDGCVCLKITRYLLGKKHFIWLLETANQPLFHQTANGKAQAYSDLISCCCACVYACQLTWLFFIVSILVRALQNRFKLASFQLFM